MEFTLKLVFKLNSDSESPCAKTYPHKISGHLDNLKFALLILLGSQKAVNEL